MTLTLRDLTPGKAWGMRRLAGADGRFAMLAADQRPPIFNIAKAARGGSEARFDDVAEIKELIVKHLAGEATAVLLDPIWAYKRCIGHVSPRQGLLLTLEDHAFRDSPEGRYSSQIADWSVEHIKRYGADGVKVLAWYRPDAGKAVLDHQERFIRKIGEECRRHDICYLLEFLVYPLGGDVGYAEDPQKYPEMVNESVRRFAGAEYGIDIFKLESPLPAKALVDPDSGTAEARRAQALFDALGEACGRPWVMLSAGASAADFRNVLTYAYRAGANGYLAGRAIWLEAMQAYPDSAAVARRLSGESAVYMKAVNALTAKLARPIAM
ncbi:MAG: tagatose 1,6-diphosphate aldolase [Hyphomicrobiales bacterium]|nr:tagatose 1,6-diphosphate aldolase [Hyphomicrobiales bacterium]